MHSKIYILNVIYTYFSQYVNVNNFWALRGKGNSGFEMNANRRKKRKKDEAYLYPNLFKTR